MLDFSDFPKAKTVFEYFEKIAQIPRGSGNVANIADYLVSFAKERGLEFYRDAADNVIIRKPATKGYEGRPTVILQGHTDMVAEKAPGANIDMKTDSLTLYRDGDFLRARDTTLGGDDGIAVAYALALLDADGIEHPEIEAVFTSDEEIGLIGAAALDCEKLRGRIMINIDSDEEGIFTVGCAGGLRTDITLPLLRDVEGGTYYRLAVTGLKGGHSGIEIDKGRVNAIKALSEALLMVPDIRICEINGGNMDNAIPRDAECIFTANVKNAGDILGYAAKIKEKYKGIEEDINFELSAIPSATLPFTADSSRKIVNLIAEEPCGVIAMSEDIKGLVETSLNHGIVKTEAGCVSLTISIRSSKGEEKAALKKKVRNIAKKFGAECTERGEYPAWEYKKDSRLRDVMCEVYREMYGKDATVLTIHAGLECGIFAGKLEGVDCVSIGPDNYDIHTTEEHLSLSSAARVWDYLLEVLKRI